MDTFDTIFTFLLTIVSFITRTWCIHHPKNVVFDEVHFGNFTNWYTKSEFYYDIHPPLGKLIMYLFAKLSEYKGDISFSGSYIYKQDDYIQLRIIPAFFSSLCGPLIYLAVRFGDFSHISAIIAACMIIFDTSSAVEGHFILSDGLLHFFCCLHIAIAFYTYNLKNGKRYLLFHVLNGLSLGAACSCKNTAWGLMGFDAFMYIIRISNLAGKFDIFESIFEVFIYGITLFLIQFFVYCLSFYIHFIILPFSGQGKPYLPNDMKAQLIENNNADLWGKRLKGKGLLYRTLKLTWKMHTGNMGIRGFHPSQSRPFNWPLLTGIDVSFWHSGKESIKCHGNVFSYYLALIGIIVVLFSFNSKRYFDMIHSVIGWIFCYFPLYLIPRTLFLYHYLIPLIFGCISYGISLDLIHNKMIKRIVFIISLCLVIFGFWLWMPFVYGMYIHDKKYMIWNQNWLNGDSAFKKAKK